MRRGNRKAYLSQRPERRHSGWRTVPVIAHKENASTYKHIRDTLGSP